VKSVKYCKRSRMGIFRKSTSVSVSRQAIYRMDGLHNWLEYVDEDRKPVINIHASPKPRYIELNRKLVQQVWDDFVPYFNSPHRTQP
jgi:hypothetical protein